MNPAVACRVRAFVALGANIGEPVKHLRAAVEDMAALTSRNFDRLFPCVTQGGGA